MPDEATTTHMTFEQIVAAVTEIAQDPDDRDRFKALKMLASHNQATLTLPEPLQEGEIIERLYRVMKPAGHALCQIAYRRAFPGKRRDLSNVPQLYDADLTEEQKEKIKKVRTLKSLYRMFPAIRRRGFPTGYPVARGPLAQMEWCRRKAAQMILDRERKHMIRDAQEEFGESPQEPGLQEEPGR